MRQRWSGRNEACQQVDNPDHNEYNHNDADDLLDFGVDRQLLKEPQEKANHDERDDHGN